MRRRLIALLALVVAVSVWAVVSDQLNGRPAVDAAPYIAASTAFILGAVAGVFVAAGSLPVAAGTAFALVGILAVLDLARVDVTGPLGEGSFGETLAYANAIAAISVQIGAVCLLAGAVERSFRWTWFALGGASVGVAALVSSAAGLGVGVLVLVAGAWALFGRNPEARWASTVGGVTVLGAALVQVAFTAAESWPSAVEEALTSRRIELWGDAWAIGSSSALIGQGPGSFVELSPAAADPDTTAAHSTLMQALAEVGVIGVALLAAVFVAGLVLLQATSPRVRLIAVAAWTAVWLHGLVDYVMDFPLVVFTVGATIGVALWAGQPTEESRAPT